MKNNINKYISFLKTKFVEPKFIQILFFLMLATLPFVNKISKLFIVLFLISFVVYIYKHKDFHIPKTYKYFFISFFILLLGGNIINSNIVNSLHQYLYLIIFFMVFFSVVYFFQQNILTPKLLLYSLSIPISLYILDGIIQYFIGYDILFHNYLQNGGISSVSKNRNIFGLVVYFFLVAMLYLIIEVKKYKTIAWIFFILSSIVIFLTLSRQIWISMFVFYFILFISYYKIINYKYFMIAILFILSIITMFIWIPSLHHRLIDLETLYSSGRFSLWLSIIEQIKQSPILGYSLHSPILLEGHIPYLYSHNLTLDILYYFGIFGFIFFISFILYMFRVLYSCKNKILKPYLVALFISLIFVQQQLGASMLIHKFVGPAMMILFAFIVSQCSNEKFYSKVKH